MSVCALFCLVAATLLGSAGTTAARVLRPLALRFHHVHLVVADPSSSIGALASNTNGTRAILQGLGVGVRVGDVYVLFDRAGASMTPASLEIAARYRRAAAWLARRGLQPEPEMFEASRIPGPLPEGRLDHIGFATADLRAAIDALAASGAAPVRRSDDAAVFRMDDSEVVEIVRDTDAPDAYWCPMHLDVRSAAPGKCAVCGMDLTPIPPLRPGEYHLDVGIVTTITTHAPSGTLPRFAGLQLRVTDPDGALVKQFATVHERPFHLFIVGRTLDYFAHVHPEPMDSAGAAFEGMFQIPVEDLPPLPPGPYMAIADVLPYGGTSQMLHRAFVTPRYEGPVFVEPPLLTPGPGEVVVDDVRVRIDAELHARRIGTLRFTITHAVGGAPVKDLEPFLGAAAHALIVNRDLTDALHVHPEGQLADASTLSFEPLMPAAGLYKLWLQFKRRGRVSTASFVVNVR